MSKIEIFIKGNERTFDSKKYLEKLESINQVIDAFLDLNLLLADAKYQLRLSEVEAKIEKSKFAGLSLKKDPKIPDWKIKNKFMRTEIYASQQQSLALSERTVDKIKSLIKSLKLKAKTFLK